MVSFIVIGKNEGFRLEKCLTSIKKLKDCNKKIDSEVLYIDSDSTDDSIQIAQRNCVDKIYKITGIMNAAVARNVGAKYAIGDILFFIDGDIEVNPFKISCITENQETLKYEYVVGFLDDVNYSSDWKLINQTPRTYKTQIKDRIETTVGGGIFIIPKSTWKMFGGMDERLKRTQDRDLSLRMARKGIKGIRKEEIFALHHTIPYKDKNRMWEIIKSKYIAYHAITMRKHIFNKHYWKKFLVEEFSLIILIATLISMHFCPFIAILYLLSNIYKNRNYVNKPTHLFFLVVNRALQDFLTVFYFAFFYPQKPQYMVLKIT